ncbi:MAG TPA: pitrilysin family protein [Acidobacteriota bacterium]|nr:insulinase family protein [Acidobacteriota bacterium]HOT00718.1 pitrilysin family protein [Acidobacteriota bacterium]HQF87440.1 pitrilysin family protein [Acidobacteriota bacterium]HQG92014.1 pitrilysin family protein [Acidobacteriota bacterium]HQK86981.1 pitrilysin family protein [Acidobacteriota bacterium]
MTVRHHFLLALAVLVILSPAAAPAATGTEPAIPKVTHRTLLNDMTVASVSLHQDRFVAHLLVTSGTVFDPPGKGGTAHITGQYLKTILRQRAEIEWAPRDLAQLPLAFDEAVDVDGIRLTVSGPPAMLETAVRLLADTVIQPAFEPETFRTIRDAIRLEDIRIEDQPQEVARYEWQRLVFTPFPYGNPPRGTPQSVGAIELDDIIRFFRRCVTPSRSLLLISSPAAASELRRLASQYFGPWIKSEAPDYQFQPPRPDPAVRTQAVRLPGTATACAVIGAESVRRKHEDGLTGELLARVLQQRLHPWLAEHPDVEAAVEADTRMLRGAFRISLSGHPAGLEPAAAEVLRQLREIAAGRFSEEEFQEASHRLAAERSRRLADPDALLRELLEVEWFRLGTRHLATFDERLALVIKEDLRYFAGHYLADERLKAVLVTGGDIPPAAWPAALQPVAARTWGQDR